MSKEYESVRIEDELGFPLYACSKELIRRYTPALDKLGLTYTQYIAMMILWDVKEIKVKELGERADRIRGGSVDASVDNMLKITNEGRKLALEQRLMNPLLPDSDTSKVNSC